MITAAIFDLNGIFLQSPKLSDRFQTDFGIQPEVFLPKLSEIMEAVRKPGALPAFQYWKPVLEEWNVSFNETEFWNYWFGAEIPSERMISFATSLRERGIKVFILSNNFKERAEFYGHYPWIHTAVDAVYFSWQTGYVKPDVRAWQSILDEHHLDPAECIYFDDQEKNLAAAISVGIPAFMFTTEAELERAVEERIKNN